MKRFLYAMLATLLMLTNTFANSPLSITVNNKLIYSDVAPFIKKGTTYVPIRFIANALNVNSVIWDNATKTVTIKNNNTSILLFVNKNYAYVNDEYKNLNNNALLVDGRTFVPLRFVSEILGANVEWDEKSYLVAISTTKVPTTSSSKVDTTSSSANSTTTTISQISNVKKISKNTAKVTKANNNIEDTSRITNENSNIEEISKVIAENSNIEITSEVITVNNNIEKNTGETILNNIYDSSENLYNDSVYWLSRIIEAEASGEPYIGKVAVGEVILNRVNSEEFPNTIWGVIFDENFGIQFEPVANGTIYNTPSEESIKAAVEALNGSNYIKNCLYFLNPQIAKSSWIIKNRQYYTTISNHDFYI